MAALFRRARGDRVSQLSDVQQRAFEGVCAALLDLNDDEARRAAGEVREWSLKLPTAVRVALNAGVAALDVAAVAISGKRLISTDRDRRDRLITTLATSRATADLVESVKIPILLVYGSNIAARSGSLNSGESVARRDAHLEVTRSVDWPDRVSADVVVVGSGAGGAMAARTLARAGLSVVVVEEGRRFGVEEIKRGHPLDRFTDLYRDAGSTVALGRPPVVLPVGRGVGGTTLVNSGTCYRTPDRVLRRWRDRDGVSFADPERFAVFLDEVESTLRVATVRDDVLGNNGRIALAGARELGWSSHRLSRNAPGCGGCCQCAIGCPRNAKFGVHLNALPDACAAGAKIVTDARVQAILHGARVRADGVRADGVRALRPDGSEFEILAERVVVAAGATETPPLLRRSGLGTHPEVGLNLAVHPAVSAAGVFDEAVNPTVGVLQSVGIDEFHESDGILVEATATPPGMGSVVLSGVGRTLVDNLDRFEHFATLGAMVADEPSGRVRGRTRSILTYDLSKRDGARLVKGIETMGRVLFAAGARSVMTGIRGHEEVGSPDELGVAVLNADTSRLHVAAFHPTGSLRMGADAQEHPVDETGRLRGVEGVWVLDASVMPSCPEVNPQVTIMAIALAVAEGISLS